MCCIPSRVATTAQVRSDLWPWDAEGNIYGATSGGGGSCPLQGTVGCGTVFKLSPNSSGTWTEAVLQRFTQNSVRCSSTQRRRFRREWKPLRHNPILRRPPRVSAGLRNKSFKLTPSGSTWTFSVVHTFDSKRWVVRKHASFDKNGNMLWSRFRRRQCKSQVRQRMRRQFSKFDSQWLDFHGDGSIRVHRQRRRLASACSRYGRKRKSIWHNTVRWFVALFAERLRNGL